MEDIIKDLMLHEHIILRLIVTGILLLLNPSLRYMAKKLVEHIGSAGRKTEARIARMIRVVCLIINASTIVTLAIIWGVEVQNIIIVFSSLFTIIGVAMFAQWSILSNITASIVIYFSMPFRIGDEIEIIDKDNPIKATVENVLTFTIHLRREEGDLVIMSNTQFLQKVISIKGS